ncbi:MAG: VWA domain-containing protein [Fimbriiglobus sp.]
MKTRHKPPALVSMWMLDVFCCALGCVTLLWLLNTREAGEQAKRAGSALETLARTDSDLASARAQLLALKTDLDATRRQLTAEVDDLRGKLAVLADERDDTAKQLALTTAERDDTAKRLVVTAAEKDDAAKKLALTSADLTDAKTRLATVTMRAKDLDETLSRRAKDTESLAAKLTAMTASSEDLARLLRAKVKERDDLALKAKSAAEQLTDLDAKLRAVLEESKSATANLPAMKKTGDELVAAKAALDATQKKLDAAAATIIDLQGDKAKLADKYDQLRTETDNRFAGITLTGKRVVFAIDISGSMKMLDPNTPAPAKWPTVAETVGRIMKSLPGLEKFQIVVFSRGARYLIGDGGWIEYEGETSVKRVAAALAAVDPVGDTNLYAGLDLAFRLRSAGLDAVYLFSDGLPTSGAGLTAEQDRTLDGPPRSELLTKHVRETLSTTWNRRQNGQRVKIHAVGFFFESPAVGAFLWALARDNDGNFVGMSRP